ncbi:unnamed protein product [Fraxinus pennsylvanica]|uniref:FBD domain-containing protein n=1 Tax=Fraxinus pennsylvanica TaxID=56036 RepID=A0AAD1ZWL9_9LAMI|nr:unnamed protein product [Fraxinus pennsylvanica]
MVKSGVNILYKEDGQNQADVRNFIMRLTGVKYLYLSTDAILAAYPDPLSSVLKYVTTLELKVDDSRILPGILERASQLEKLVISSYDKSPRNRAPIPWSVTEQYDKSPRDIAPIPWPVTEPSCLACLRRIEFGVFINTIEEMHLIEYLLKHGRMLEKMVFCGVRSINSSTSAVKKKNQGIR